MLRTTHVPLLMLVLAACDDSSGDPYALDCPAGTDVFRAAGAPQLGGAVVFEEWCKTPAGVAEGPYRVVDETGIGTNGERGAVVPGPVVLVSGQFADGLAQGLWHRWNKRYYAANFTLDPLGEESWDRGLADGTWLQYGDSGTASDARTRSTYRGGVACDTWKTETGTIDYLPCEDVGLLATAENPLPPSDSALGAPVTTDFGWDGKTCPDGSAAVPEANDVRAFACWKDGLRDGPFGRWYGAPGTALIDKRDDGAFRAGRRTGPWRGWHSNEILAQVGDYDGERTGPWRFYFADGWLFERADFTAGLRDGLVETFHDGGHRASVEAWRNGFRDGAYASWRADGAQVYEGQYVAGLMEGDWTLWSDEWGVRAYTLQHWSAGLPSGTWNAVYESSGEPAWTVSFVAGNAEGPTTQWWESGGERLTGQYAVGRRWGTWRTFFEDGTLESESAFAEDHLNGPAKAFYPDGSPRSEGVYENDERAYTWTVWDAAGNATTCTYPSPGDPACP